MTSFRTHKRFAITLALLLNVLICGSLRATPGNDQGTKGTGSAGKTVVETLY